MGTAYTPGLTVSADTIVSKTRRLPLKGKVLVEVGETVGPDTVVARAELPGIMQTVKAAAALGVDPPDVPGYLTVEVGASVQRGQVIGKTRGLWGLFPSEAKATTTGLVEIVSPVTGNVGIREAPTPIEVTAYIPGVVTEVLPGEGVVVTARGAFIQGIFGIGGERRAPLVRISPAADTPVTEDDIRPEYGNHVIIGGSNISGAALRKAAEVGVVGIVVGGIIDTDLVDYLGYDIGVAITGHESIPLTLVLTEGFGTIAMAERTFALLSSLEGRSASLSGATQIRAGVIRPEIIIAEENPNPSNRSTAKNDTDSEDTHSLSVGTPIRIIREPYFGELAIVTALPPQLVRVNSGAEVRVLEARLTRDDSPVTVPRANVEIIASRAEA
jgi:hypothetical protein